MASFRIFSGFFSALTFLPKRAKTIVNKKVLKKSRLFIIISTFHFLSFLLVRNLSDSPLNKRGQGVVY